MDWEILSSNFLIGIVGPQVLWLNCWLDKFPCKKQLKCMPFKAEYLVGYDVLDMIIQTESQ